MIAPDEAQPLRPYADSALAWFDAGWSPLPLPARKKYPPPEKFTGYDAKPVTRALVKTWIKEHPDGNIAIALPPNVIGIDVDSYGEKHGDETLAALEETYDPLPPTMRTSARGGANPSGIRWFRIREGATFPGVLGEGIEVIQSHHRYAVVAPSWNPKSRTQYRTYDDRDESDLGSEVFAPDDIEELPESWYEAQAVKGKGLDKATELDAQAVREWFSLDANAATYCRAMRNVLNREREALQSAADDGTSRYDTARDGVMALVRLAQEGHRGCRRALSSLKGLYEDVVADEPDRDPGEWRRMVTGAVEAVAEHMDKPHPAGKCPDRAPSAAEVDPGLWPSPNQPFDVAERFVRERYSHGELPTLRYWRGDFYSWSGVRWAAVDADGLKAELHRVLNSVSYLSAAAQPTELRWNPNITKINNVVESLRALCYFAGDEAAGDGCIAFANGVLSLASRSLAAHSPARFNLSALPFDFSPAERDLESRAPEWFAFLDSLELDGDEESLLQEWFGYVVSGETRRHKMMLLIGPPRAGKGVITRTLQRLVGRSSYVSPTLDQFAQNFGLQSCIGKSLITINDARFGGRNSKPVIERLLNISGADDMTIDRKNRDPWEGVLPGRIMIVSNELPNLSGEASSALASRFVGPIELENEFLGREDEELEDRLTDELPVVLAWALEGLDRLHESGKFTRPARSRLVARELAEALSPMLSFLRECCDMSEPESLQPDFWTSTEDLFKGYQRWSDHVGRSYVLDKQHFARELRVASKNRVQAYMPRVNGKRVMAYRGIRLLSGIATGVVGLD